MSILNERIKGETIMPKYTNKQFVRDLISAYVIREILEIVFEDHPEIVAKAFLRLGSKVTDHA